VAAATTDVHPGAVARQFGEALIAGALNM